MMVTRYDLVGEYAQFFGELEEGEFVRYSDYQKLESELAKLRDQNDPALDGTDGAHPAYWRGCDAAFSSMSQQALEILNGKEPVGVCQEPWQSIRKHIWELRAFKEACEKEEPVAKVYDPYDTPGIHWHCNTPPYSGMPLYTHPLAAEQIRKEERERILKIFEAQDIDPAFKNRILEQLVEPLS